MSAAMRRAVGRAATFAVRSVAAQGSRGAGLHQASGLRADAEGTARAYRGLSSSACVASERVSPLPGSFYGHSAGGLHAGDRWGGAWGARARGGSPYSSSSSSSSSSESGSDSDSDSSDSDDEVDFDNLSPQEKMMVELESTTSKKQQKFLLNQLLRSGREDEDDEEAARAAQREQLDAFPMTIVSVNRTCKVTKGGGLFRFNALVVCGNGEGFIGYGMGKSGEVAGAIDAAYKKAMNNLHFFERYREHTIYHDQQAHFGKTKVRLIARPDGAGLRCNTIVGAICKHAGIKNLSAKVIGSHHPHNTVKATFKALGLITSPYDAAEARGKKVREIIRH